MKHSTLLFLVSILFPFVLSAQSDFRKGYIINNNNDTIYGLINYRGDIANSRKCEFKKDSVSQITEYEPGNIKAYRFINSKYYVSKTINKEGTAEPIFLEYLINGVVDIYYYRDNSGDYYFADDNKGELLPLKNDEVKFFADGVQYVKESKAYIGMLKYLFKDEPAISKKVDNLSLDHKSLIKITTEYQNKVCPDEQCIVYEKKLPKIKFSYGISAGINIVKILTINEFKDYITFYYLENSDFSTSVYPNIGILLKMSLPNINEKLFLQYEGSYCRWESKTLNSFIEPVYSMNVVNDISFTINDFSNSLLVRYEFPKGKYRPVFQAGLFADFYFSPKYSRIQDVKWSWGDNYDTKSYDVYPFKKFNMGPSAGIGLIKQIGEKNQINFDLIYQHGFGITQYLSTNSMSLNISFQFN